jgi:transmembrane sensor
MQESEELLKIIAGDAEAETKKSAFEKLNEDPVAKEEYNRLKNAWALLASEKEMTAYRVENMYLNFQKRLNSPNNSLRSSLNSIFRYAAVFIIAVGLTSVFFNYQQSNSSSKRISGSALIINQEISANFGARMKFKLSDGTIVFLNSGSKLLFPNIFEGKSRRVELSGEAFFDVTTNPDQPFIVHTNALDLKVFGTEFNLKAYPDSKEISATLEHGKIVIEKEIAGIGWQLASLKPSQRAVYNTYTKDITVSNEQDLDKFIAWKDGKLVFSNDPIKELAEKLGIWYNVNVKIGNEGLRSHRFTATFTDEPIEQVLDLLSKSTPLKFKIIKAEKLPNNSYSKRTVILN